jgi:hypothetical protein
MSSTVRPVRSAGRRMWPTSASVSFSPGVTTPPPRSMVWNQVRVATSSPNSRLASDSAAVIGAGSYLATLRPEFPGWEVQVAVLLICSAVP